MKRFWIAIVFLFLPLLVLSTAIFNATISPNQYVYSNSSAITTVAGQLNNWPNPATVGPYQVNAWNSGKYSQWGQDPYRQSMTAQSINTTVSSLSVTRLAPSYDMGNCFNCQYSLQASFNWTPTITATPTVTLSPTSTLTPTVTVTPTSTFTATPPVYGTVICTANSGTPTPVVVSNSQFTVNTVLHACPIGTAAGLSGVGTFAYYPGSGVVTFVCNKSTTLAYGVDKY